MWEKLRSACALFACCLVSISAFGASSNHLLALRSRFPYGLLGEDYGILAKGDLAMNACQFTPKPFPPDPLISPYEYWQCFETKTISLNCGSSGIEDEDEGVMGLVVVKVSINQIKHEYIERRPWPMRECRSFLKDLSALLKGRSHACLSGSFIEEETDQAGGKMSNWLFERLKTRKGCEGRGCNFTEKIKQEYCPNINF